MNKFLIFVEDPGVVNMILDFPILFKTLKADYKIIANSYAADILTTKNFCSIELIIKDLIKFLKNNIFDIFIVGTSENKNSLGLELIKIAKIKNILSIGLIDMLVNYKFRFSGNSNNPLNYAPDKIIVTDTQTRNKFVSLGFLKENIYICKHPQEEKLKVLNIN